jgi:hypothetical protein
MNHIEHKDRFQRRAHAMIATMGQTPHPPDERRETTRRRMLATGTLQMPAGNTCREIVLYTRDATEEGVGFIAAGELAEHTRARLELPGPTGRPVAVTGELVRTRPLATGWHEGYVRFDTPMKLFCETPIRAA